VDGQLCAACHLQIAKTYALTGMARSFYKPPSSIENQPFFHEPSGTWYAMVQRDGKS
jgi:hypothetical protein